MPRIGRTDLEVVEGDLTALDVDAIVNAANRRLAHGGGVAGAIARRGGPQIQAESDAWVQEHGEVPTGSAALTTAGDLPARWVIHAVGPVYDGSPGCASQLAGAVRSALALADQHGLESVALPAISTGIYGYPLEEAAAVLVQAAVDYLDGGSGLRRVVFCLFGEHPHGVFARELARFVG